MENDKRAIAQFWARLASIRSLDDLREGERLLLVEDMQEILLPWLNDPAALEAYISALPPTPQAVARSEYAAGRIKERLPKLLSFLHHDAQRIIVSLFLGEEVMVPIGILPQPVWSLKNGQLQEQWVDVKTNPGVFLLGLQGRLLADLIQIIRDNKKAFPFRICPECSKVFVPVKRQKYCSPNCTYKGVEAARKEEKRSYMKAYMARKRKKLKARQGREEK
jgi:hypothetical protein